jgi:hypothetical protein
MGHAASRLAPTLGILAVFEAGDPVYWAVHTYNGRRYSRELGM